MIWKEKKFKSILNKEKYIEAFKDQTFPQIRDNLGRALNSLVEQNIIVKKNGTINNVGQEALRRAIQLNNGAIPAEMAKQLKGRGDFKNVEKEVKEVLTVLGILAYFVKGGPELFKTYLKHNNLTFDEKQLEKVSRQEDVHKSYEKENSKKTTMLSQSKKELKKQGHNIIKTINKIKTIERNEKVDKVLEDENTM